MAEELVSWNDDFLVGNESIDAQHKQLVKLTNDFYAGVRTGKLKAKVYFLQTIKGAVEYVRNHFTNEEEIMREINFPLYDEHKRLHEDFVAEVIREISLFEEEENPNPEGFVKYLMNWIFQHIANSDKKYVPFLARLEEKKNL